MQLHLKWKSDKVTKLRSNDGLFLNAKTFLEYKNIIAMKKKKPRNLTLSIVPDGQGAQQKGLTNQ